MNAVPSAATSIRLVIAGVVTFHDRAFQADILARFWAAKSAGDSTASMTLVSDTPTTIADDDSTDDIDSEDDEPTVHDVPAPVVRAAPVSHDPRAYIVRGGIGATAWQIIDGGSVGSGHPSMDAAVSRWTTLYPGQPPIVWSPEHGYQPVAPPTSIRADGVTVSPVAVARIARDEAMATAAGFDVSAPGFQPIFERGTRVVLGGDLRFAAERRRIDALPAFRTVAESVIRQIQAENRADVAIEMAQIRMHEDGRLYRSGAIGSTLATVSRPALRQLLQRLGTGCATTYLADFCPPDRRAMNVNADIDAMAGDRTAMLRTRTTPTGPEVYAVLSTQYMTVDADAVLAAAIPALDDCRAEIKYDGYSTRATCYWMPDHVVDLACGDIFKAGVRISTDDTGAGRIRVEAVLFRNRCLNLIIIGEATVATLDQVHRGSAAKVTELIAPAIDAARELIAPFLAAWGTARSHIVADPAETLRALVYGGALAPAAKGDREDALKALQAAWAAEPGNTMADIANAATRAAHEWPDFEQDYRDLLERKAAQLVYAAR